MLSKDNQQDNSSSPNLPTSPAPPIRVNLDSIAAEMKAYPCWFCWRWSWHHKTEKWTKVPVWFDKHPRTGVYESYRLRSHLPCTWHTFDEVAAVIRLLNSFGNYQFGAAFRHAPENPFTFIDIDDCIDPVTRGIHPKALEIVRRFNSYTEVTTRNHGLRINVVGEKPDLGRKCTTSIAGLKVEIYDKTQYSVATGNRLELPGLSTQIEDRQAELTALYHELFPADQEPAARSRHRTAGETPPARPSDVSDTWVIDRLSRKPYWHGPNKSEQDLQLCNLIAYYVGPDPARIEHILFASPARRPKWRRSDYIARTIDRAIEFQTARGFYADRQAELDGITPATPEDVAELFATSRRARLARQQATDQDRARTQQAAVATAAVLIASLSDPPPPDQVREDEILATAAEQAASQAAHADRPPPCTCGYKRSMYHSGRGIFRACHVLCGRWRCSTCAPKKKAQWQQHLRECITTIPIHGGAPNARRPRTDMVYIARVRDDPTTTRRILKHIQRQPGNRYARVKYSPGRQLVVSTVPLPLRDNPTALAPIAAAAEVVQAIRDILIFGDTRKPIFTCRAWKLPPRKPAGWTVVGDFPSGTSKSEIVDAMNAEVDGTSDVRVGNPGLPFMPWVADCHLPRPPERPGDEEVEPSRIEEARAFHTRLANRILGLPASIEDGLTSDEIDQLFGVPAGP